MDFSVLGVLFFFLLLSALFFVSGADERGGVWCVLVCWSIGITIDTPVGLFWGQMAAPACRIHRARACRVPATAGWLVGLTG
jgi:hypothetical protein